MWWKVLCCICKITLYSEETILQNWLADLCNTNIFYFFQDIEKLTETKQKYQRLVQEYDKYVFLFFIIVLHFVRKENVQVTPQLAKWL